MLVRMVAAGLGWAGWLCCSLDIQMESAREQTIPSTISVVNIVTASPALLRGQAVRLKGIPVFSVS